MVTIATKHAIKHLIFTLYYIIIVTIATKHATKRLIQS